ncbi:MAG TPA: hypothetical protein VK610_02800 [Rhodothermales bacterium]|nr:hypothetical protein [Rhodothermales bacterium]
MHRLRLALVALPLLLTACAGGATFDEVEGVPDSRRWSYFEGTPEQVADALRSVLTLNGYTIDAVGEGPQGTQYVRVTSSPAGADFTEVYVEPVNVSGYTARAQTVPGRRRLARSLEVAVSADL